MKRNVILTLMFTILSASIAVADVPLMINYQGRLTNSAGYPLDTTVSIVFTVYDDPTGGNPKWTEPHSSVTVTNGLFSVLLGSTVPISGTVFIDPDRYLGIAVGDDSELQPRTRLISAPYAYHSLRSDSVGTIDGTAGGTVSGDLTITGKATLGPDNVNSSPFTFVAGNNNSLEGNNSTIVAGHNNTISAATASFIGAGRFHSISGGYYSAILGGCADTITSTADSSVLIGNGSKLTQAQTFMVDMQHIRFGDETTGYEFPTQDGTAGQIMVTDGSGQLGWSEVGSAPASFRRIVQNTTEASTTNASWTELATLSIAANEVTAYISITSKVYGSAAAQQEPSAANIWGELRITIDDILEITCAPVKDPSGSGLNGVAFGCETFMTLYYEPTAEQKENGFTIKVEGRQVNSAVSYQGVARHLQTDIWGI